MKIIWTPQALKDRSDIWDFISADNPIAASDLDDTFSIAVSRLAEHPLLGRHGHVEGTRELIVHPNYRLVYEMTSEVVWILALVHTARQWPLAYRR
ncbi:MAG: type II toxin-antitoxin system mRNA interferase toxin, RelE/StbE family [Ideonella sp. MAG2]|nr:MAG: type II toxin-antitoxin system mRNA interferase toxin, RelE/StbE family [Ideonella sp. MAG2]